jgi:hypothetical protein
MDHWVLELFPCSYSVIVVVRHRRVIVGVGRLIHNPNERASCVSRPPEISDLVLPQGGVHLEVFDIQNLLLVLRAYVPQFHGEILLGI